MAWALKSHFVSYFSHLVLSFKAVSMLISVCVRALICQQLCQIPLYASVLFRTPARETLRCECISECGYKWLIWVMTPRNSWAQWESGAGREGNQFLLWHFWSALNTGKGDSSRQMNPLAKRCRYWQRNCKCWGHCGVGRRYKQPLLQHHSWSFRFRQTLAFCYHI